MQLCPPPNLAKQPFSSQTRNFDYNLSCSWDLCLIRLKHNRGYETKIRWNIVCLEKRQTRNREKGETWKMCRTVPSWLLSQKWKGRMVLALSYCLQTSICIPSAPCTSWWMPESVKLLNTLPIILSSFCVWLIEINWGFLLESVWGLMY